MTKDELQSRTIDYLRFPLIIGVVFIHAFSSVVIVNGEVRTCESIGPLFYYSSEFFSHVIARTSIPLFFIISGFLFFYRKEFTPQLYKEKLKSRFKSLFIPYLYWNIFIILYHFIIQSFPIKNNLLYDASIIIRNFTFADFAHAFGILSPCPINYPFWFIRDLMLAVLISPLIHSFIKKTKVTGIVFLGVVWYSGFWFHPAIIRPETLFFFSIGAFFSINKKNIVEESRKLFTPSIIIYPIMAIVDLLTKNFDFNIYIHKIGIICGCVCFINIIAYFIDKEKITPNKSLVIGSFIVYAIHEPFIKILRIILFRTLKPESDGLMTMIYFIIPISIIFITLFIYYASRKLFPRFTKLTTGGR